MDDAVLATDTTEPVAPTEPAAPEHGGATEGHWADALPEEYRESMKGFDSFEALQSALKGPEIPETYEAPEGADTTVFESFSPIAKELGLSQDQVNALVKFDIERMGGMPQQLREKADAQMQEGLKQMASEMGKEKYDAAIRLANQTLKTFADDQVGRWLEESGMGNSPVLVRLLAKIGERLTEDSPNGGGQGGMTERTPENIMYPNMG